jgi:hypothetical protein
MDTTEVTVDGYGKCVAASQCTEPVAYDAKDSRKKCHPGVNGRRSWVDR